MYEADSLTDEQLAGQRLVVLADDLRFMIRKMNGREEIPAHFLLRK